MTIDPVGATSALPVPEGTTAQEVRQSGFESWFARAVGETNAKIADADRQVQQLVLGETDNLHHVMIALEEARLSFQLLVQVRNKLLEGYQELLRMQV